MRLAVSIYRRERGNNSRREVFGVNYWREPGSTEADVWVLRIAVLDQGLG